MSHYLHTYYLCFGIKALKFFSSISCHIFSTSSRLMSDLFFSHFIATLSVAQKMIILLVTAVPDIAEDACREMDRHTPTWAMGYIRSNANYSKRTLILSSSVNSGYIELPACFLMLEVQPRIMEWTQNSGSGPRPAHRHNGYYPIVLTRIV